MKTVENHKRMQIWTIKIKIKKKYKYKDKAIQSPQARRQDPIQPGMVPTQGLVCNISGQKLCHQKSQMKTLATKKTSNIWKTGPVLQKNYLRSTVLRSPSVLFSIFCCENSISCLTYKLLILMLTWYECASGNRSTAPQCWLHMARGPGYRPATYM